MFSPDTISDSVASTTVGSLQLALAYDAPSQKLKVRLITLTDVGAEKRRVAIHVTLLPSRRFASMLTSHKHRSKTYIVPPSGNIKLLDRFTFRGVDPDQVMFMSLQFRLTASASIFYRHKPKGESVIPLFQCKPINQERIITFGLESNARNQFPTSASAPNNQLIESATVTLAAAAARLYDQVSLLSQVSSHPSHHTTSATTDSSTSENDKNNNNHKNSNCLHTRPELLVGLSYRLATGTLSVKVIHGTQFDMATMTKAPDTYVKLVLHSINGQEVARNKTTLYKGTGNPKYSEEFLFPVPLFQLGEVSLLLYVYQKLHYKRKILIGWCSFGQRGTTEEEIHHWNEMSETELEVRQWHPLHFT